MLEKASARGKERRGSKARVRVRVVEDGGTRTRTRADTVATEEPMEIRLISGSERRTVAVTMRTPGSDFELAAGFLYGEGVVSSPEEIERISYCVDPDLDAGQRYNVVNVKLRETAGRTYDLSPLERSFYTTSACGVCGKASLEQLELRGYAELPQEGLRVTPETIYSLPRKLREEQGLFEETGGLHAAALFDVAGELLAIREDVGRHNATDKLVGWALLEGRLPLRDHIVMVSGRTSYEILQKCVAAGAPIVCAVSAPSSLAVDVARTFGVTLVGFLRGSRFNVYSSPGRVCD
jgi:FdhD protein